MKYILAVIPCFVYYSLIFAQTIVPEGEVSGLWEQSQSPYQVTGDIHIPKSMTLSIEPGVVVQFQGHYQLKVEGSLLAEGTELDSILFTVNDTAGFSNPNTSLGGWNGIRIYDNDHMNDSTKLAYCRLEFGKAVGPDWFLNSGGSLCVIDFHKVRVSNSLFTNNMAWAGGAVYFHESNPVFINNLFIHNRCIRDGGAVSSNASNPSFSGDVFIGNHSDQLGGGIYIGGASKVLLENLTFTGNEAHWGGGLGFQGCKAEIWNSTISNNRVDWLGGGLAADGSVITIRNSVFEEDSSTVAAGAIHTWQGTLELDGVSFTGNGAWQGGAIHSDWSTFIAYQSSFFENSATDLGGALKVFNSHMTIDSCTFNANSALVDAGAIDYAADTLVFDSLFTVKILNSRILENMAGRASGGLSIQQTHTRHAMVDLTIDRCEIANNRAQRVGGFRIMRCPEIVTLSNSIVHGNRVDAWTGGGAIAAASTGLVYNTIFFNNHSALVNPGATTGGFSASSGAKVDVINCTFFGNSAGVGGGMMAYRGGDACISNSLFWGNSPEQLGLSSVFDSLPCRMTLNYNDIQYGLDSIRIMDTVSSVVSGLGNIDADPLFTDAPQADFHLSDASPAIGRAIDSILLRSTWFYAPSSDIDGLTRPNPSGSKPDMGAHENNRAWPVGVNMFKPENFKVLNYPNPFRHSTTFEFFIAEPSSVSIEIYNLLGMKVGDIDEADLKPGLHQMVWGSPRKLSGIFFYRITKVSHSNRILTRTGCMVRLE